MKSYVICYDISDEKRLVKLAKLLEQEAFRIQKSIFVLWEATENELLALVQKIKTIIDQEHDDVRVYAIKKSGYCLGAATNLDEPFLLIGF